MYKSFSFFDPAFIGRPPVIPPPPPLVECTITTISDPFDGCSLTSAPITTVWASSVGGPPGSEAVNAFSFLYTDSGGTTLFNGDNGQYRMFVLISSVVTSATVDPFGQVGGTVSLCS